MGVTSSECHTPRRSRIRRLACESASGRKAALDSVLPRIATFRCEPERASASAQPTGPAPRMRTSVPGPGIPHQRFDFGDALGCFGRDDLARSAGDDYVILDADADVAQRLWHVVGCAGGETGLHGERHTRLERSPLRCALVFARIVHVEPEPVSGTVHVEALVGFLLEHLAQGRREKLEVEHALREHAYRGLVRLVPCAARAHLVHGRLLRGEDDLVALALGRAEAPAYRECARDIGRVPAELAP